jgi:hypothetical protein
MTNFVSQSPPPFNKLVSHSPPGTADYHDYSNFKRNRKGIDFSDIRRKMPSINRNRQKYNATLELPKTSDEVGGRDNLAPHESIEDSLMQPIIDLEEHSTESAVTKTQLALKSLRQQSVGYSRYLDGVKSSKQPRTHYTNSLVKDVLSPDHCSRAFTIGNSTLSFTAPCTAGTVESRGRQESFNFTHSNFSVFSDLTKIHK